MSAHLQRALLLLQQSRTEMAEKELRRALADEPNNPMAHAVLAICLSDREQYREATSEAEQAVALAPDASFPHYALAGVLEDRNRHKEARRAIEEAIRIDPEDADQWARLSSIELACKKWDAALTAADNGLAIDPEDTSCTNLRAIALVKLGRPDQAGATIDAALSRDPDNADTHANQGWTLLHAGEHKKALEHFREALRLEPNHDWARSGIVEALKSRHFVYRIMLSYFLWMARLSGRAQWGILIGGYIGYRVLASQAGKHPGLDVVVVPLMVIYIGFAVMTWISNPLFNLLLRLSRFGRLVLSREETLAANCVGGLLLVGIGSAIGLLVLPGTSGVWLIFPAVSVIPLIIVIATFGHCSKGWPRMALAGYAALVVLLALLNVGLLFVVGDEPVDSPQAAIADRCVTVWLFAVIAAPWIGNILAGIVPKK
jgi:tetratricopeptide (TPR) repeat protein